MKHFITSILLLNCYLLHAQTQLGSDIDGEAAGDYSGNSVSNELCWGPGGHWGI